MNSDDAEAWRHFALTYGPRIVEWCRALGLQDADCQDVAQEVLILFARRIKHLEYDPNHRFRSWLREATIGAWNDWVKRCRPWHVAPGGSEAMSLFDGLTARDDLVARLQDEFDQDLLRVAMRHVESRVEPRTWYAFRLMAIDQLSGEECAARIGMKVGSALAARSKVQRMIRQEIQRLDRLDGEP